MLRKQGKSVKDAKKASRIEKGTVEDLLALEAMNGLHPVELKVFIVQPGLSKAKATRDQLEFLSVTENHLMETDQLPFTVHLENFWHVYADSYDAQGACFIVSARVARALPPAPRRRGGTRPGCSGPGSGTASRLRALLRR